MRRRVHGWWPVDRERGKERERERSGESGREIRDAKHEIYRKLERRATPVRVSTWLFCIQFRLKRRRGFVSLDKFKLEWPCVKVNLWDRLLEEEIFSGCDLKRRKEMFFILFFCRLRLNDRKEELNFRNFEFFWLLNEVRGITFILRNLYKLLYTITV